MHERTRQAHRGFLLRDAEAASARSLPLHAELQEGRTGAAYVDPDLIARARATAYEDGWAAGHTDGVGAALRSAASSDAEARARVERSCQALAAAAERFDERQALELDGLAQRLTEVAVSLAEAVLGAEVARTGGVVEAVRRALTLAPRRGEAIVHLHPEDVGRVPDRWIEETGRPLTITADGSIERGGCLVEVGACTVDAQLGSALARVREELGL